MAWLLEKHTGLKSGLGSAAHPTIVVALEPLTTGTTSKLNGAVTVFGLVNKETCFPPQTEQKHPFVCSARSGGGVFKLSVAGLLIAFGDKTQDQWGGGVICHMCKCRMY